MPENVLDSPLVSQHTQPAGVEGEGPETLGGEEGGDCLLAPGQHLHRHRLLPHAAHGQAVAVDIQQGPDREVDGQTDQVAASVVVVDEQPQVPARTQTEGQAGPVLGQALLGRRSNPTTTTVSQSGKIFQSTALTTDFMGFSGLK